MRDKVFYAASFGFILGVLARSFIFVGLYACLLVLLIAVALLLFFLITRERKREIVISVFVIALSLGVLRFHTADVLPPPALESFVGGSTTLDGIIADEPVITDKNQRIVVETELAGDNAKVLVSAGFEEEYEYGDMVSLTGKLRKPENFMTGEGKEFDYVNYLRKDGISYVMYYPDAAMISRRHGNPVKTALFAAKNEFLGVLNLAIPEPESALMGGLILGERAAFRDDLRQDFIDTGTIHIVALSGYNVTIVAEWIMKFLAFLPRNAAFGAGVFSILLFVLMAGASSTAVRAGIMATLALIARATGRQYDVARALLFAVLVMVLWNPFILRFDVSFQLSVLATMAVIFLAPRAEEHFFRITKRFGLRDIAAVTTSAYIFVLPFILYEIGNLSLIALPANFLVLPFIPVTMALGFLTGAAGLLWRGLAVPFGFIAETLLSYELGVISFLADVPFAALTVPHVPLIIVLALYGWFAYLLFGKNIKAFFTW